MSAPVIGIEGMLDTGGVMHPWRVVLADGSDPATHVTRVMPIPSDVAYFASVNHPLYGDLRSLAGSPGGRLAEVAADVHAQGGVARIAEHHHGGIAHDLLVGAGVVLEEVDVDLPLPGEYVDPYAIGGPPGHEIAAIARTGRGA